jgi:hypothetical protein
MQQNTLLTFSQQIVVFEKTFLIFREKEKLSRRKTVYNHHVLEKKKNKNFKIKRLFSFIIACYSKSLNTIRSFREVKKRDRLILRDFHHIFQDVIVARQKDFELDFDYNSFTFKLFSSIISSQFFRKFTFDSFSDIDFFDLEVFLFSSFKSLNKSFDRHVSLKQLKSHVNSLRTQSFRS